MMNDDDAKNQGEGDVDAARRYDEAQKAFVERGGVEKAAADAAPADEAEARELEQAEREGKSHAKGEDPTISSGSGGQDGGGR